MINSISFQSASLNQFKTKKEESTNNKQVSNPITTRNNYAKPSIAHLQANFLSFGSNQIQAKLDYQHPVIRHFNKDLTIIWNKAVELAKKNDNPEVTSTHLVEVFAHEAMKVINGNPNGKITIPSDEAILNNLNLILENNQKTNKNKISLNDIINDDEAFYEFFLRLQELQRNISEKIETLPTNTEYTEMKVSTNLIKMLDDIQANFDYENFGVNKSQALSKILVHDMPKPLFNFLEGVIRQAESMKADNNKGKLVYQTSTTDIVPINNSQVSSKDGNIDLSKSNPESIVSLEHFENKAKTVGALVSSGNSAIFTHDKGSMPELLAHSFTKMVKAGEFKDLNNDNTQINLLKSSEAFNSGKNPISVLDDIKEEAEVYPEKNFVVFVEDMDYCVSGLQAMAQHNPKYSPSIYFSKESTPNNFHIIGSMKKPIYNTMIDTESPYNQQLPIIQMAESIKDNFEKFELGSPSPEKTKQAIKSNPQLLESIAKMHPEITIENDAIDKAVDLASTTRKGATLGKSIDLLSFVAGSKANAEGKEIKTLSAKDVVEFSKNYPELRQSPESGSGQFKLIHNTGITMKDVGGAAQAKDVVEELLDFIKKPEKFEKTGAKIPKGILLHGTPGNGKTHLAKAIAGEANAPFVSVSGSEFVEKYVGVGAGRVRELFEFAAEQARSSENKTAIIFIDEFDSLGRARGGDGGGNREAEQTLNQLLVEMDGLGKHSDVNIVVLAATNRPDLLDTAITDRPGRFDHKVEVPNPANDPQARYEILNIHARSKNIKGDREAILREVAGRTSGSSGARLADIINKAAIIAAKDDRGALELDDFIEAKLESVAGRIHKDNNPLWYKELVVAHECGHATVIQTLQNVAEETNPWHKASEIDLITTDSRGNFGGAVFQMPGENKTHTFESMFAEIACCFGGNSVEKELFGMFGSSGISSDIQQATNMAKKAVEFGMGPNTKMVGISADPSVASMMSAEVKKDIQLFVNSAAKVSDKIIAFHKEFIEEYKEEFKANAGKGGNNLSGQEFKTKLNNWIVENGKEAEYAKLKSELKEIMKKIQTGESERPNRIGFYQK